jgi:hypothetical protein
MEGGEKTVDLVKGYLRKYNISIGALKISQDFY